MKRILHVTSEAAPFARTGGLGDASVGLARATARADRTSSVALVTPRYGTTRFPSGETGQYWEEPVAVHVGGHDFHVGVRELPPDADGLRVLMLEHDELFGARQGIYGDRFGTFGDNGFRFATMSAASLEIGRRLWPEGHDLLHAHDWHAALAVLYARLDEWSRLRASVFTLHNLAHQGVFGPSALATFGLPQHWFVESVLEHHGAVNLLKGATALADRVTAVSPRYAWEITTPEGGFGLDTHLAYHRDKLRGIVNGIDTVAYDPKTDPALPMRFDRRDVQRGKATAATQVRQLFGLHEDNSPLFCAISRFDTQKGLDVLFRVIPELLAWGAQIAVIGQGDPALERAARSLAERFAGRLGVRIAFEDTTARQMYAAADFVLVPSRFEPCGLTQLYAMRYGSVPIVSRTGGLLDTVRAFVPAELEGDEALGGDDRRGPGLMVGAGDDLELLDACVSACELARDRWRMARLREWLMSRDWSWEQSAAEMIELYRSI